MTNGRHDQFTFPFTYSLGDISHICQEGSLNYYIAAPCCSTSGIVEFRSTGVYLSYRVKEAPTGWTDQMKKSLLSPTNERGKFEGLSVSYTMGGDEKVYEPSFPEIAVQEDGAFAYTVILPIFPSDYEDLKLRGVTIHLTLHAIDSFNAEPVSDTWSTAVCPEGGFDITTSYQPLVSFLLDLP